jgi:SAM-dependent methyltransferase
MGFIGGQVGYTLLRRLGARDDISACNGTAYANCSKLEKLMGASIWDELRGKVVLDFGCGSGAEVIEVAQHGALRVIGLDIRESVLVQARQAAGEAGVADRCSFASDTTEKADVILSVESFEHFADPAAVLRSMRRLIKDDGRVMTVFGPTWYHPLGGHLFSVFPWAHLIFTEAALLRWRSDFKTDRATRFHEVEGGLNQMTIRRFEKLVAESDFRIDKFELVPIRGFRFLRNRWLREFGTAVVRCTLSTLKSHI